MESDGGRRALVTAVQPIETPLPDATRRPLLSVVVPAYRQEATIVEDVTAISHALEALEGEFEIIVVVDGFVDGTYQRAQAIGLPHVRVLGYGENGGKGHAVRFGMRQATGEYVAFIDAGMDLDPRGLVEGLETMRRTGADIAMGSKRHPASRVEYPLIRRLYSVGYQSLVWLLFGLSVRDTQVGLKLFRRDVVDDVLPLLLVKQYAFDVELLVVAALTGHTKVVEIPVTLTRARFPSTIRFSSVFVMLWDTAAVFYRAYVLRYYHRLATQSPAQMAVPGVPEHSPDVPPIALSG